MRLIFVKYGSSKARYIPTTWDGDLEKELIKESVKYGKTVQRVFETHLSKSLSDIRNRFMTVSGNGEDGSSL